MTRLHGALETNHVSFFYGGRRVLDDVSLTIAPGEFIGIVGSSGSGKSTLMALLTGQETPLSGVVLLDGSNMRDLDRRQLTRQMGIVTQNSRLFPGSLFDNIRGASAIDMAEAWQLAEEIGLAETISALPMGMKTIITDTGSGLSASQVQRILIARALAGKPLILALDEATSILDGEAQSQIQAALRQRAVTRIVIAHRSSTLQDADRLIRLEHGRIVDIGDPDRILRDMSVYDSRKDES